MLVLAFALQQVTTKYCSRITQAQAGYLPHVSQWKHWIQIPSTQTIWKVQMITCNYLWCLYCSATQSWAIHLGSISPITKFHICLMPYKLFTVVEIWEVLLFCQKNPQLLQKISIYIMSDISISFWVVINCTCSFLASNTMIALNTMTALKHTGVVQCISKNHWISSYMLGMVKICW